MSLVVITQSVIHIPFVRANISPDMHKRVYGASFKKRAPKAIKAIKEFAKLHMVLLPPFTSETDTVCREQTMCEWILS